MPHRNTLQLLEVFRGAAATLVVLYHVGTSNHFFFPYLGDAFRFGHSGVDFFFVLSGFIMLYVHLDDAGDARSAWRFLALRAVRIYPIYWVVLAATVAAFWTFGQTPPQVWAPESTLEAGTLLSAVLLWHTPNVVIPPVWTLSYELVFYAFFALLFVCGRRVFAALSLLWCTAIVTHWAHLAHLGVHPIVLRPIVLEFFVGCVAALVVRTWCPRVSASWMLVPIVLLVGLARAELDGAIDGYKWYAVPYFLLLLLGASYDRATRRTYPRPLVLLGEASYAIYLVHFGLIALFATTVDTFRPLASIAPNVTLTLLVAAILAAGTLLHVVVERPLLAALRQGLMLPTDRVRSAFAITGGAGELSRRAPPPRGSGA